MTTTPSETIAFAVIDRWLEYRVRYSELAGIQVAIRRKGELVFSKAYGHANQQIPEAYTPAHLGRFASHSKMFTSCALHLLAADGKLRLDQPALDFLPELRGHRDRRFADITIRDLLANRSGLCRDGLEADFWDLSTPFPDRARLIDEVLQADLVYDPNTVSKYSNYGFGLLGLVIEAASGMNYGKFVQSRILDRLPGTTIYPEYRGDLPMAAGHSKPLWEGKRRVLPHASSNAMGPGAGFCANAESLSLFVHQLLEGDLLPEAARRELLHLNWPVANSETERYGLGVQFDKTDKIEFAGHSGGYPGFTSQTRRWLGTDYTISFIMNSNELFGFDLITSIARIIETIGATFTPEQAEAVVVSDIMMEMWGSFIFAVGAERALSFNLAVWSPCKGQTVMQIQTSGAYVSHKANGFSSPGEDVVFVRDIHSEITGVKWGGYIYQPEADFLQIAERICPK